MKVLITGGLGLIGSRLAQMLLAEGHDVRLYDGMRHYAKTGKASTSFNTRAGWLTGEAQLVIGDIRDRFHVAATLQSFAPDVVVHLAAIPLFNPRPPFEQQIFDINLQGSRVVFEESAKQPSVRRILFASSSMAYGHFTKDPQPEEALLAPIDMYGVTKASGELLLKEICREAEKEWVIIRPTSVYGPTDCNNRVIQRFVEAGVSGAEAISATTNEQLDFTHVDDIAHGFQLAVNTEFANKVYNISAGKARLVMDAAKIVQQRFPLLKIVARAQAEDGFRPVRGTLDITLARSYLGYTPKYALEAGINAYIDFVLAQQ